MKKTLLLLLIIFSSLSLRAAQVAENVRDADSLSSDTIRTLPVVSKEESLLLLEEFVLDQHYWKNGDHELHYLLRRLLDHSNESFDSVLVQLDRVVVDSIELRQGAPELTSSIKVRWLNDSTFVIDPKGWSTELYTRTERQIIYDESVLMQDSTISDSLFMARRTAVDTLYSVHIDTAALNSLEIRMFSYRNRQISPSLDTEQLSASVDRSIDRVLFFSKDTSWVAHEDAPFNRLRSSGQLDSLQSAIGTLLAYNLDRDSTLIWLNDMYGKRTPYWLTEKGSEASRYWVKNYNFDSVTLWISNPSGNELNLLLEDDVNFSRLAKEEIEHLPEFVNRPRHKLFSMKELEPVPIYWDYSISNVFTLNQTYLSNWTKGGESSFSMMGDIQAGATYNNKDANTQWINTVRFKFGTISTQGNGFRKNNDNLEIQSKFNRNAWGKLGMSASFYWKNQVFAGYSYPTDSTRNLVSKFLNPSTLTLGLGVEYKPFKETTINLAPLSFKNTFVLDTANIDQTSHGIPEGQRANSELGLQLVATNTFKPLEGMTISNNVRLFSNYLNKPQNIDVDWELTIDQKIAWFFTIRLNLHLIYNDDVRFPVYDDNGSAITLPDGSEKTVAKAQFKEFIGLSMQFKF